MVGNNHAGRVGRKDLRHRRIAVFKEGALASYDRRQYCQGRQEDDLSHWIGAMDWGNGHSSKAHSPGDSIYEMEESWIIAKLLNGENSINELAR